MDSAQAKWEAVNQELRFGRLRVFRIGEALDTPPRDYILKGLMSPAEVSLWVGPPKCGKSFLMLYLAYAIAQGRSVFERRVKHVPVLYVAAEGEAGIAHRLRALRDKNGEAESFFLIAQPADLLHDDADLEPLIQAAQHIEARLIVIDTLSRAMAGGDENGPQDMGKFIANIGDLCAATGAHVAIVHHGTKESNGTKSRGHSSLTGAADAVIEVVKGDNGARTATVAMAKDDQDGIAMGFRLDVAELGTDADNDPVTTCVVEEIEAAEIPRGPRLTRTERTATKILADLIAAQGKPLPVGPYFPQGFQGVPEAEWRAACESRRLSGAESPKDRARVFRATYTGLRNKCVVGTAEGIVWLAAPEGSTRDPGNADRGDEADHPKGCDPQSPSSSRLCPGGD